MIITKWLSLITICHHTKLLLWYYWLYSLCCISVVPDPFGTRAGFVEILFSQTRLRGAGVEGGGFSSACHSPPAGRPDSTGPLLVWGPGAGATYLQHVPLNLPHLFHSSPFIPPLWQPPLCSLWVCFCFIVFACFVFKIPHVSKNQIVNIFDTVSPMVSVTVLGKQKLPCAR